MPTLRPELEPLQNDIIARLRAALEDPSAGLDAIRSAATQRINSRYIGLPDVVSTRLAQRGMGSSGHLGRSLADIEIGRSSDLSGMEAQIAELMLNERARNIGLGEQLIGTNMGRETQGSGVYPGNVGGGAVTGGLQGLASILGLKVGLGKDPFSRGGW